VTAASIAHATMPASTAHAPMPASTARVPQHMLALEEANRVRLARAALKRSIARGEVNAASIVLDAPPETENMTLAELLGSQRRWGRTRVRKFLGSLALGEGKRLGSLTPRQRLLLARELDARQPATLTLV
jgi:hypothetical protein